MAYDAAATWSEHIDTALECFIDMFLSIVGELVDGQKMCIKHFMGMMSISSIVGSHAKDLPT